MVVTTLVRLSRPPRAQRQKRNQLEGAAVQTKTANGRRQYSLAKKPPSHNAESIGWAGTPGDAQ